MECLSHDIGTKLRFEFGGDQRIKNKLKIIKAKLTPIQY